MLISFMFLPKALYSKFCLWSYFPILIKIRTESQAPYLQHFREIPSVDPNIYAIVLTKVCSPVTHESVNLQIKSSDKITSFPNISEISSVNPMISYPHQELLKSSYAMTALIFKSKLLTSFPALFSKFATRSQVSIP